MDSILTSLKIDKSTLLGLKDKDLVLVTNIENNLVRIVKW